MGLIAAFLLLITITALIQAPEEWYIVFLVGLIAGFALGTVFGIWIAKRIGNAPNPQKLLLGAGIVLLNASVGFFGFSYLTGEGVWPKTPATFGWSIATASTLVSAAILCLVNFFWHSRDQQRINTLRAALNKSRARIANAEASAAAARRRAEEANADRDTHRRRADDAEREATEQRQKAEQAQQDAEQARTTALGAERTAQQAQQIAAKEKRWRSTRALLLGHWQCTEYSARSKDSKSAAAVEIFKEPAHDQDEFVFAADETFTLTHPGKPVGLFEKWTTKRAENDLPFAKSGRWKLEENGETLTLRYDDGKRETFKIRTIAEARMTIDRSSDQWEMLRYLVKVIS